MFYNKRGFTLIELLVAISIIATLTAILVPNMMGARERAHDAQHKQDLVAIKNALRMYYNDNQKYPTYTGNDLNSVTGFKAYMPGIEGVGFTYSYQGTDDSFYLYFKTEVVSDTQKQENVSSHTQCGIGATDSDYMICAL